MTLAEALAPDVADRTRVKGNRYFLGGAVRGIEGSDTDVVATVRGSEWYSVHLHRDGDAFTATCQCPYFQDRLDFCKHVWAVVLAADAEGLLLGDTPLTPDAYLEIRREREGPPAAAPLERREPARERWQQFLHSVQERASAQARPYASRYSQGEMLYVITRSSAQADVVPTVQVHYRTRKKNGEWGSRHLPPSFLPTSRTFLKKPTGRSCLCCSAPPIHRRSA